MTGRIPLFRVLGIQVTANWSWAIIVLLITTSLAGGLFPAALPGRPAGLYWFLGVVGALLFFASLLAHELAHSLVARAHGIPVREILLFVFGGVSNIEREAREPGVEFGIAVVGPLTSFVIAAVCWALARAAGDGAPAVVLSYLAYANTFVGAFNLIPGFPLDGGRVLRAFLWHRWRDLGRATRAAAAVGQGIGWVLIALGALQALAGSFVGGLWMVLIGMFLQGAAAASAQQAALREQLAGVRVEDVMTPERQIVTVPADMTADRLVDDVLFRERYDAFPVRGPGRAFVGMVGLDQVRPLARDAWAATRITDIMRPARTVPRVAPGDDAVKALERMLESGEGRLPVVRLQRGGAAMLVGIVTRRDIMHLLRLRSDLGAPAPEPRGAAPGADEAPRRRRA